MTDTQTLTRETSQSFVIHTFVIQKHRWTFVGCHYCHNDCHRWQRPPPIGPLAASLHYWQPQHQFAKLPRIRESDWIFGRPKSEKWKVRLIFKKNQDGLWWFWITSQKWVVSPCTFNGPWWTFKCQLDSFTFVKFYTYSGIRSAKVYIEKIDWPG